MPIYPEAQKISELISKANSLVVVQADNPDSDSLASSLALEQILGDMGKDIHLFCGVELPSYLMYLPGADRVLTDLPKSFDASIIVDTSSNALLEQLDKKAQKGWLASKPSIIIDHHSTEATIDFANVTCNYPAVSTGEIIYELAQQLKWDLNKQANEMLAISILSDSLGLMSGGTTARSIHIIGELVEAGVSLPDIENARRETMKRAPELVHYKGRLLERVEFYSEGRIAIVMIPWEEIEKYSPSYNPSMLVIDDMRMATGTEVAIAFKLYKNGKVTAKIRSNYGKNISGKLAEHFNGGGHDYAAGFKIQDGRNYEQIKQETIEVATNLLNNLKK